MVITSSYKIARHLLDVTKNIQTKLSEIKIYLRVKKKSKVKLQRLTEEKSVFEQILVNLHNRTEEERRWQILRDKRDNNFV